MENYYDLYQKRLNALGNTDKERIINREQKLIEKNFKKSLNYFLVQINGVDTDAWITNYSYSKKYNDIKNIITQKTDVISCGDLIDFNGSKWLIITQIDESNEIYNIATIRKCNQILTLTTGEIKTQIGVDEMDRPIYDIIENTTSWDCIVDNKILNPTLDESINLPEGKISIIISYSDIVKENMKFQMWNEDYQIVGIDKTINGIITILANKVVK
jgi:hypothetical protein